jgi:hypothetical protein
MPGDISFDGFAVALHDRIWGVQRGEDPHLGDRI